MTAIPLLEHLQLNDGDLRQLRPRPRGTDSGQRLSFASVALPSPVSAAPRRLSESSSGLTSSPSRRPRCRSSRIQSRLHRPPARYASSRPQPRLASMRPLRCTPRHALSHHRVRAVHAGSHHARVRASASSNPPCILPSPSCPRMRVLPHQGGFVMQRSQK